MAGWFFSRLHDEPAARALEPDAARVYTAIQVPTATKAIRRRRVLGSGATVEETDQVPGVK
jgi:hypothetical protein